MMLVILHGNLRQFGKRFRLHIKTPAEAIRALSAVCPGFKQHIAKHSTPGYHVLVGKRDIDIDDLANPVGEKVIRIVPAMSGANSPGLRIIVGAVMLYASGGSYGYEWIGGALSSVGTALIVSGVSQIIAGTPKNDAGPREEANNQPSFAFDGPVNTVGQGHAVPLLYGRMIVGSAEISAGLAVEQF